MPALEKLALWGWGVGAGGGQIIQINLIRKLGSVLEGDKCQVQESEGQASGLQF